MYPCPVGADTPAGCMADPCPPKIPNCKHSDFFQCCKKDKWEDCVVSTLGCTNTSSCSFENRLKLSKFLGCFEGGHIVETECPQDPKNCSSYAGLDAEYPTFAKCYANATAVKAAGDPIDAACKAENISNWPHVKINNDVTYDVVPILPTLCQAYKGSPKPNSCTMLEAGLITVV
jgi:hypothetical protein